jgi:CubicO group peptidase (beta-lactamase class C family)
MLNRRQFLIGMGSTAIAVAARRATASPGDVEARAEAYLGPLVARKDYSGYVLLERTGQVLLSKGFGFADDAARRPHSADTHYASASIGKMFTHAAILSLEAARKLHRQDKIARFLPDFPSATSVTIQHLLDHRSGIARDLPQDTDLTRSRTLDELVRMIAGMPREAPAGERTAYSNNGYRVLARIVERAGGGDYDALVRETVFEPRRMRNTFPNLPSASFADRTVGHWPGPGWDSKVAVPPIDLSNHRGAGSFAITPGDMLRFLKTLPLEPGDAAETPSKDADGTPTRRKLGHDGFGEGYANLAFAYPEADAYLVSLSNMQTGAFMPMHTDLQRLLFGDAVTTPSVPRAGTPPPIQAWDRYVGDYDLRPGAPLRIRRSGDVLTADAGEGGHPLIPLGGDRFFMRLRYATMAFEGEAKKPATLLRWAEGGGEFPLKRIG